LFNFDLKNFIACIYITMYLGLSRKSSTPERSIGRSAAWCRWDR